MEEAIELVYRIRVDHGGSLSESEAHQIGPWVEDAARRAEELSWLVVRETPPVLKVTYGERKALDAVLASRTAAEAQPNWFAGSIGRDVRNTVGPHLLSIFAVRSRDWGFWVPINGREACPQNSKGASNVLARRSKHGKPQRPA
jgi:hypothetical protein